MKVSVVIPCYNAETYIDGCLDSVVRQTWNDIEILCVNDGSEDGTYNRLKQYRGRNSDRIQILNQSNKGAGKARNTGLNKAKGRYIQFLDADDRLMPGKIENQLELISQARQEPDIVAADYILKTSVEEKIIRSYEKRPFHALFCKNLGITSANLWRRESVVNTGGFDENLGSSQEYELMFRLLKQGGKVLFDPVPLTYKTHREDGSISATNKKENRLRFINLQLSALEHLKESGQLNPEFEKYIYHKLFYEIRLLHEYDAEESCRLYRQYIPASFRLNRSSEISKKYVMVYDLLGYHGTQKVYSMFNRFFR